MKKRLICIAMSIVLVFVCTSAAFAQAPSSLPIIMVSGYSSSSLYLNYGTAEQEKVWNTIVDELPGALVDNLPRVIFGLVRALLGNCEPLGNTIGQAIAETQGEVVCNPDGTSKYDISTYPNDPAKCTFRYLTDENGGKEMAEWDYAKDLAAEHGGDSVFFFHVDFRQGAIACAEDLNEFVNDVLEYTSEAQVKLFGLSHGGQIVGTYLSLYGTQGKVDKAVMAMPALRGTDLAYDVLTGSVTLADHDLIAYAETALNSSLRLAELFKTDAGLKFLDSIAVGAIKGLNPVVKYWTSLWDFVPTEKYEKLKNELLNPTESAELIANSDRMHYEIMPNFADNFAACQAAGVDVAILSGMGLNCALGSSADTDCIINTASTTGAFCAEYGKALPDGYTAKGTVCSNPAHNHISPDFTVDASCAYLPENTWYVDGLYHGMYYFEDYTLSLVDKLLFTDEISDIYSSPEYPQFVSSGHNYLVVGAALSGNSLTLANNTEDTLIIRRVTSSDGVEISMRQLGFSGRLAPGEKLSFEVLGDIPAGGLNVKVDYIRLGSLNPFGARSFMLRG